MSVPSQSFGNELNVGPVFGIPVRFSPWFLLLVLMVAARSSRCRRAWWCSCASR
ncbi:MAG: hypothetical protein H6736_06305 [Alphaproteobacteria bacterium]|nr:hypothetical protein [Alphaproteobacteria bacterium]